MFRDMGQAYLALHIGHAYLAFDSSGLNNQYINFDFGKDRRFSIQAICTRGSLVTIKVPKLTNANLMKCRNVDVIQKTSFHKFLGWIHRKTNQPGNVCLDGIVATISYASCPIEIRFRYDAGGNLFLLFSNPWDYTGKPQASVVISYHDLHMVFNAWNSFQGRTNYDYLRRSLNNTEVSHTARQVPHRIIPILQPFEALAQASMWMTNSNETKSPLHLIMPTIPDTVVNIISQYTCNPDNPTYVKNGTTRSVIGPGMGTFATLFLDEIYDPSILDLVGKFIYIQ
jgi:hypothetical protein